MTHEDRVKLIQKPFGISQRVPAKSWGGVNVGNAGSVPEEGHRTHHVSTYDDSYLRYGKDDQHD